MSKTTQSFKQAPNDRIKKQKNVNLGPKKGGFKGWGKLGDEMNTEDMEISPNDPNYDPMDHMEYYLSPGQADTADFKQAAMDLNKFKSAVRKELKDYMINLDVDNFVEAVEQLNQPLFHQELPRIIIRYGVDQSAEKRTNVFTLLAQMFDRDIISMNQFSSSFDKIFASLEDIQVDAPNALDVLKEFTSHAVANNFLEKAQEDRLLKTASLLQDRDIVQSCKKTISSAVKEYLTSGDAKGCMEVLTEMKAPHMHFEVVKRLISIALDGNNMQRQLASDFLTCPLLKEIDVSKGFTCLLERMEDLILDVPDVFTLLSWFLARAVVDEALPPSFLLRVDLADDDMGQRVAQHAHKIVHEKNAAEMIMNIWSLPETYDSSKVHEEEGKQE